MLSVGKVKKIKAIKQANATIQMLLFLLWNDSHRFYMHDSVVKCIPIALLCDAYKYVTL